MTEKLTIVIEVARDLDATDVIEALSGVLDTNILIDNWSWTAEVVDGEEDEDG